MEMREAYERPQLPLEALLDFWGRSARATHLFLAGSEVKRIEVYAPMRWRKLSAWPSPSRVIRTRFCA